MMLLAGPHKSDSHEVSQTAKRCLRGIKAETKVLFRVILILVRGLMMVRI